MMLTAGVMRMKTTTEQAPRSKKKKEKNNKNNTKRNDKIYLSRLKKLLLFNGGANLAYAS